MFIFNLNVVFTMNFLKMAPIRVRFSPGYPPGGGFPGEEFAQINKLLHDNVITIK
jgi:hypothetical protein